MIARNLLCPYGSEQIQEFLDRHFGVTDKSPQSTHGKLLMLRNREICPHSGFGHNEMASHLLTHNPPARFLKSLDGFFAGNVRKASHLQGDYDFGLASARGQGCHCFLVLGTQPCDNRFLDVVQGLLLVFPLRNASGQGRTFGHDPAVLGMCQYHVKDHLEPLRSAIMPILLLNFTKRQQGNQAPAD